MTTIVFEPTTASVEGQILGYFKPMTAYLGDAMDAIVGQFAPMEALNQTGVLADIHGVFPAARAYIGPAGNLIVGTFEQPTAYITDAVVAPDIVLINGYLAPLEVAMTCQAVVNGTMYGTMPMTGLLTDLSNVVIARLPQVQSFTYEAVQYIGGFPIVMDPGYVHIAGPLPHPRLVDNLAISANPIQQLINTLTERLLLLDTPMTVLQGISHLRDAVEFVDQLAVIWKMLLQDSVALAGVPSPSLISIERVQEALNLVGGVGSSMQVRNLIAETLALNDALAVLAKEQLSDAVAFGAAFSSALTARMRLLDQLLVVDVPTGSARILALIDETIAFDGTTTTMLQAFNRLREDTGFCVTLTLGDTTFVAWVVNTETRAAWEYTNYPFGSFAEFEGRYYGMATDGLYSLEGADDAGEDIQARIRLGMSNMGINREKRVPALYLSYAADDRLIVKAITTEIDGSRTETWYQLVPRGTGGIREGRVQFGRGLKSVHWDFEITNVNGADFELAGLEFLPMILDRKVRGRDE